MFKRAPEIEPRKAAGFFEEVKKIAPYYVPEWRMEGKDASCAFWKVFAHLLVSVVRRLNQAPDKNLLAFLEMLGFNLLPAQPARAPLTFALSEGAAESVEIPARTQAAAGEVIFETERVITATPAKLVAVYGVNNFVDAIYTPPPGFLESSDLASFSTVLARAAGPGDRKLFLADASGLAAGDLLKVGGREWVAVAGVDGATVMISGGLLSACVAGAAVEKTVEFELFRGRNEQEHIFYLGHAGLFNLKKGTGRGHVLVRLVLKGLAGWRDVDLSNLKSMQWEYWGEERGAGVEKWLPFKVYRVRRSQDISLAAEVWLWKIHGRSTKEKEVAGVKCFWIRAAASAQQLGVPALAQVTAAVHNVTGPDMAFANDVPVDLNGNFYPFGKIPRPNDVFYITSQECFSKKGEVIDIGFELAAGNDPLPADDMTLSWEYWDGKGWRAVKGPGGYLKKGKAAREKEFRFQGSGGIYFTCPQDFEPVEVNGQKNYWLRVRILSGSYGIEEVIEIEKKIYKSLTEVRPPLIKTVKMKLKAPHRHDLQHVLTCNGLEFVPVTSESRGEGTPFKLFYPLMETHQTLYLGFDRALGKGPVSVFFVVQEQVCEAEKVPRLVWEYFRESAGKREWVRLDVVDGTQGMTRSGAVEFVPPADMLYLDRFGRRLYYLRAVDVEDRLRFPAGGSLHVGSRALRAGEFLLWRGASFDAPRLKGICLNATWVKQVETVRDEIIGSSTGMSSQLFKLSRLPVVEEELWVNEAGSLTEEERAGLAASPAVMGAADQNDGTKDFWVEWQPVEDFSTSTPESRHYMIDRTAGTVSFGDGVHGMIPPAGQNNLRSTYRTGGGNQGNVDKGAIATLRTALAFVDKVYNPQPAGGGADVESLARVLERAPAVLKHRGRAVTVEDFEQLAKEASPSVARTRCLPNFSPRGEKASGWVTVLVVPSGGGNKPALTPQLKKQIEDYLGVRMPCTVFAAGRLQVSGPVYAELTLRVKIITRSIEMASTLENLAFERVSGFLHPLYGGYEGKGWEFGNAPCMGDFYKLLEELAGVDYVEDLSAVIKTGSLQAVEINAAMRSAMEIPFYALVCSSGRHELKVEFRRGG